MTTACATPATLPTAAVDGDWHPGLRLGAESPGGLALPAATATRSQLYAPRGVWLDDERLIACDSGNHRILIWHRTASLAEPVIGEARGALGISPPAGANHALMPTRNSPADEGFAVPGGLGLKTGAPASIVLGQPSFMHEGPNAAGRGPENGLHLPTGVIVAEGRLLVADAWHHRILVWNRVPEASDTPPDWCLGQPSLADVFPNRGGEVAGDALYWPYGLAWIGGRLHVADTGNRRVLIWNGLPDRDAPADVVLGQPDMVSGEENRGGPVGPASFRWPHALAGDERMLFVADAGDHRVLGWRGQPHADRNADVVLGQDDFRSAFEQPHVPQGPKRLRFPYGIALCDDLLAVADTANNRVLFWRLPLAEAGGAAATGVIGQHDFAGGGENRWEAVLPDTLCWPYGICMHATAGGRQLAVADSGNNRVTVWIQGD